MKWLRKNGFDLVIAIFACMFLIVLVLGLVALGKEFWCYMLTGCGG